MENLPELFDKAELLTNWSAPLKTIQTLSETGGLDPLPDWLAVEIIWMKVQFEQQLLNFNQKSRRQPVKKSLEVLKKLACYPQVIEFDRRFPLLDQQYLYDQGIATEISNLSQYLAHPKSKETSPHPLFSITRYKNIEQLNQSPHHPLVHFFRHSSGCRKLSSIPNNYFDCDWYRENYMQGPACKNPLLHYLAHFHETDIQPNQHFNNDYVRQTQHLSIDDDPLAYYLKQLKNQGVDFRKNGFSPCPYFDRAYYLASYQDIKIATEDSGLDPFWHFSVLGIKEDRKGHPWLRPDMVTEAMVASFSANKKLAVLILGMHRSGTSALTKVINLSGLDLPSHLMEANFANETGYWESVELEKIHNDILFSLDSCWDSILAIDDSAFQTDTIDHYKILLIDYLVREFSGSESFVIKDPRMCRLIPLWIEVLDGLNVQTKIVLPFRHPLEVARSLQKRDGLLLEKSLLLWLIHVISAERHTRGLMRCFVCYSQLLADPQHVIHAIAEKCGIGLIQTTDSEEQIRQFIDGQYYHQRITDADLKGADISGWVLQAYGILDQWAGHSGDERNFRDQFDHIADSMAQADKLYGPIIREKENGLQQLFSAHQQIKIQGQQLASQLQQLLEQNDAIGQIASKK